MEWIQKIPHNSRIYIYGAGKYGRKLREILEEKRKDVTFLGFIDTYLSGDEIVSWDVFKKDFKSFDFDLIIIASELFWHEMKENLESIGVKKYIIPALEIKLGEASLKKIESIKNEIIYDRDLFITVINSRLNLNSEKLKEIYNKKQNAQKRYMEFVKLPPDAVVIEGGMFEGEVTEKILERLNEKGKIYCFDLYGDKFITNKKIKTDPRVSIYKLALWSKKTKLYFSDNFEDFSPESTYVSEHRSTHSVEIEAISIDEFVEENGIEKIDFIKLDIEGAEIEALKGARKTIGTFKPQLAIAVYHEISHYWEIPEIVKQIYPEYKVFFEHYSDTFSESIMYFIPPWLES